jgi:hypothetical protein
MVFVDFVACAVFRAFLGHQFAARIPRGEFLPSIDLTLRAAECGRPNLDMGQRELCVSLGRLLVASAPCNDK